MTILSQLQAASASRMTREPEQILDLLRDKSLVITAQEAVKLKKYLSDNNVKTRYYETPADLLEELRTLLS